MQRLQEIYVAWGGAREDVHDLQGDADFLLQRLDDQHREMELLTEDTWKKGKQIFAMHQKIELLASRSSGVVQGG